MNFVKGIGYQSPGMYAAFSQPLKTTSPVIETTNGFCVVHPLYRSEPDSIDYTSTEIASMISRVESELQQNVYQNWIRSRKKKADITSNIHDIYLN